MANPFTWGNRKKNEPKDYFTETIFSSDRSYSISEEQAMQIPGVKSSVELIASAVSSLPIYLYEEMVNGDINDVEDKRVALLNGKANKYEPASKIKKLLVKDLLLYGKAYLYRKDNEIKNLPANKVVPKGAYEDDGIMVARKVYVYNGNKKTVDLQEHQVIEFTTGTEGVLVDGERILNQAINELDYTKGIMTNGSLPIGILKASSRLTETAINRLRTSFENLYGGAQRSGKTMILEEGLDYQSISLNPNELQLNETSKHTLASVARLFGVPLAMIDSSANKYASLEQNNIHFLQYTISPLLDVIESTLNQNLLEEYEQNSGLYFRFDTSEILRTTEKELVETTVRLLEKGLISKNEARAKLDYKKVKNDYFLVGLGSALEDTESGDLTIINLGQTIKEGGSTNENGTEKPVGTTKV